MATTLQSGLSDVLTLKEAAAYLRITEKVLRLTAERYQIPAMKIKHRWLFNKQSLTDWLAGDSTGTWKYDEGSAHLELEDGQWVLHYSVSGFPKMAVVGAFKDKSEAELAASPFFKRLGSGNWTSIFQEPTANSWNVAQYTADEYQLQLIKQAGKCGSCGDEADALHWDHDHDTGDLRDLLCGHCNKELGFLRDSSARCDLAAAYLRRFGR